MNIIKRKALSIIGNALAKTGTVLAVRAWQPATFFEVDVHFPNMDMSSWEKVQYIKVNVEEGVYRDYTPAGWDEDTRTCTLYVDGVHDGPGSRWAKMVQQGDEISYIGPSRTFHRPLEGKMIVLGDMSALGHYLALQQLAGDRALTGAVSVIEEGHLASFYDYFKWEVDAVKQQDEGGFEALLDWTKDKDLTDTEIFIVGHIPTSIQLRKELKKRKDHPNTIRVQGFWS
ncbi:siderophore-interacting protein [Dyadobacter psychrotolerans]|nr:siderophore-interacting protein [Dyadobacter psychrotolerans]